MEHACKNDDLTEITYKHLFKVNIMNMKEGHWALPVLVLEVKNVKLIII